jgi:hypothetical protein
VRHMSMHIRKLMPATCGRHMQRGEHVTAQVRTSARLLLLLLVRPMHCTAVAYTNNNCAAIQMRALSHSLADQVFCSTQMRRQRIATYHLQMGLAHLHLAPRCCNSMLTVAVHRHSAFHPR